jgi:hypothetical protein
MLLQNVVGIDNTGKTFPCMQVFHISESARTFRFIMKIWATYFFYDCPGPAIWCGDFAAGLTAAVAQQAAQDAAVRRQGAFEVEQAVMREESPDPLQIDPLPTAPSNDLDSQTIIVDWVAEVEDTVRSFDGSEIFLQRCEWHAAEAIKKNLIKKGYRKARRDEIVGMIWNWIKADDFNALETNRNKLIRALNNDEKEYLIGYY